MTATRLADRRALSAGGGIGRASALYIAREGARVAGADIDVGGVEETAPESAFLAADESSRVTAATWPAGGGIDCACLTSG